MGFIRLISGFDVTFFIPINSAVKINFILLVKVKIRAKIHKLPDFT